MRHWREGIFAALVCAAPLVMAACGGSSTASNTATLASADISPHTLTVPAGTTVHFVDPADSTTHQLCLGTHGACHSSASGPAALREPGLRIRAGQTKDVTFPTAGTYQITCTIHPPMNLTITVR